MFRKLSLFSLLVVVTVSVATPASLAQENMATVHGTIYDLWTFTPLENVVVEVYSDSILQRQIVALDGTYSLSLQPGSYTIMAKHYSGTTLISDAQENITLRENDNITLDLIMFPAFEEDELPENYDILPEEEEAEARSMWLALGVVLVLVTAGAIAFYYRKILPKKRLPAEEIRVPPSARVVGLPEDLNEVLNVIRASGGRINQVELR